MSVLRPSAIVVLAAGEGTRMKSAVPKVLHRIGGRSLLGHALAAAAALDPGNLVVVVRHERDLVAEHVAELHPQAVIADQDEIKGTGRAVQCGLEELARRTGEQLAAPAGGPAAGPVVVTYGDVPLLQAATLTALLAEHAEAGNAVTVLTAEVADPTGYGRVLRDGDGSVLGIVEHKDADEAQRAIREINSGIYVFDAATLARGLGALTTDNSQGEMYLTDVLGIARAAGGRVGALATTDVFQVEGVNDRVQLATLGAELNRRVLEGWMRAGVTVIDPPSTWVDVEVRLARDVTLLPGTQLHGGTEIGESATIGPDCSLTDCVVGAGAEVVRSHGSGALIAEGATVGPFSYLRPGTKLGERGKIGAFVEVKNSSIGARSKVPHLSYVGDATIGTGTNIGAATVVVNYDGVAKHRTTIGDHVRVGSDSMLVAPVTIGDGAYTAAGSVITDDVPPGDMGVARSRQQNISGWVRRRRPGTASAAAADAASPAAASSEGA